MANVMRWRHGATNPVTINVASATVIEIGDLIGVDTTAKPVEGTSWPWDTNEATSQEKFHDAFLGVATQASRAGDTDDITVATSGVFEMIAESDTYLFGQLVGPYDVGATGTNLGSQSVEDVATANLAIGRVARRVTVAATSVFVDIKSTLYMGGPQEIA